MPEILFDPRGEHLDPGAIYVQVVRKGIVDLPPDFDVEVVGEFGNLRVVMPAPSLLVAAELARGTPRDVEDAAWWMMEKGNRTADDIRTAIGALPNPNGQQKLHRKTWCLWNWSVQSGA